MAALKTAVAQYACPSKCQMYRPQTKGTAEARATVSWSGRPMRPGEYAPRVTVLEGPRRQPRRDRGQGLPPPARARYRFGRRLLRGRPRLAARAARRRGVPGRPRPGGGELPRPG